MTSARSPSPRTAQHLGHVPPPGDATIQKISTDGNATVSVDFTIDLDNRHDHLTEKDGLLYVSCGTNGAQAFVVAVDPVQETVLARTLLPYPGGARAWSGSRASSSGRTGRSSSPITAISTTAIRAIRKRPCNGRARISWRNTCCPIWAARISTCSRWPMSRPRGRLPLQFGSALDAVKLLPAAGLFPNGSHPSWQLRVNNSGAGDEARVSHTYAPARP
jgi:hypothetical protein